MKKVLALSLALVMVLGIVSFAASEEVRTPITTTMAVNNMAYPPEGDTGLWPELQVLFDTAHTLLPGYDIKFVPRNYENLWDQLPILCAAGDVSDITAFPKFEWMQYIDTGLFLDDLTELVDNYGPNIRTNFQPQSLQYCTVAGKLKAIPCENFAYKYLTWLRKDWLVKLGFEVKDTYTVSEFAEILRAFATKDPDGNGKNDSYGLGTRISKDAQSWDISFMSIFGAFGGQINQSYLNQETGEVSAWNYSDEFRDALQYLQGLYADKAIDQEVFILNYDQALQNAANGRGGAYCGWWNDPEKLIAAGLCELDPDFELCCVYITSDDGTKSGIMDKGMLDKATMISSSCEHPEAAMALLDMMSTYYHSEAIPGGLEYNGTIISDDYLLDENGNYMKIDESRAITNKNIVTRYSAGMTKLCAEKYGWDNMTGENTYHDGFRTNPFSCNMVDTLKGRQAGYEMDFKFMELSNAERAASGEEQSEKIRKNQEYQIIGKRAQMNKENRPVYTDFFYGTPYTDEYNELTASIQSTVKDYVVRFVTGELELTDENWAAYKQAAVAQGAQTVLASMVKEYNTIQGTSYTAAAIN